MLLKHEDVQTMVQLGWVFKSAAVLLERWTFTTVGDLASFLVSCTGGICRA